jgi:hypothetical protein
MIFEGGKNEDGVRSSNVVRGLSEAAQGMPVGLDRLEQRRAEIHNCGRRGRDTDNELRTLQANFAKAWAVL